MEGMMQWVEFKVRVWVTVVESPSERCRAVARPGVTGGRATGALMAFGCVSGCGALFTDAMVLVHNQGVLVNGSQQSYTLG